MVGKGLSKHRSCCHGENHQTQASQESAPGPGPYLGVGQVDTMAWRGRAPGKGGSLWAPWKPSQLMPAGGGVRQPVTPTQGKGGEVGAPARGTRSGRAVQAPLEKGRFHGFQHGHSSGRMTAPHPRPKLVPRALGGPQGQTGCLHPTDRRGRRGRGGLPPALGSILKPQSRPFHRGSRPGREGGWGGEGRAGAGAL